MFSKEKRAPRKNEIEISITQRGETNWTKYRQRNGDLRNRNGQHKKARPSLQELSLPIRTKRFAPAQVVALVGRSQGRAKLSIQRLLRPRVNWYNGEVE